MQVPVRTAHNKALPRSLWLTPMNMTPMAISKMPVSTQSVIGS